jgi:hypothetical protein
MQVTWRGRRMSGKMTMPRTGGRSRGTAFLECVEHEVFFCRDGAVIETYYAVDLGMGRNEAHR